MLICLLAVAVPTSTVVLGGITLAFMASLLLAGIFDPMPQYTIANAEEMPKNDSPKFLILIESLFLSDKGLVRELCRARERGSNGRKSDHLVTRSTSRGGYGPLLKAGAEVYEYHPSMIHAKVLVHRCTAGSRGLD